MIHKFSGLFFTSFVRDFQNWMLSKAQAENFLSRTERTVRRIFCAATQLGADSGSTYQAK
jgi:hypothetical protein